LTSNLIDGGMISATALAVVFVFGESAADAAGASKPGHLRAGVLC